MGHNPPPFPPRSFAFLSAIEETLDMFVVIDPIADKSNTKLTKFFLPKNE